MSNFYAQHSGLVKTLGSAAPTTALAAIANRLKTRLAMELVIAQGRARGVAIYLPEWR